MFFIVSNSSLIIFITSVKTMINPASETSVAISSLSLFFKTCVITVIKIPIAAILNIMLISIYITIISIARPVKNPSLIYKGLYFFKSFSACTDNSVSFTFISANSFNCVSLSFLPTPFT